MAIRLVSIACVAGATLAIGGLGSLVYLKVREAEPGDCRLCERKLNPRTAFCLVLDGRLTWACCPRCGLAMGRERGWDGRGAAATDYTTGQKVKAEDAVYVRGSDLTPCCSPTVIIVGSERAVCGKCFDRCYPSLIAFASPRKAYEFTKEHGGEIVSFETLMREQENP
jgi:hypothetical protein